MPVCAQVISPQAIGLLIKTSDVTEYDGPALNCVAQSPPDTLNDILAAIDDAICANQTPTLCVTDICWDCTLNLSTCFDAPIAALTPPVDLCDVLNIFAELICQNATDVGALTSDAISYSGAAPSNYTATGSSGLDANFEGIDNELGTMQTDILDAISSTELDLVIGEVTDSDWVESGGNITTFAGSLTVDIDISVYYTSGARIPVIATVGVTLAATSDNYLDVTTAGAYSVTAVGIGAPAPGVVGQRLHKIVTNGVGTTATVDLRNVYPFDGTSLSDNAILTRHITALNVTGAKMENIVSANTVGDGFLEITYDAKGRITATSDKINITAVADKDLLQWDSGTSEWLNVSITGTIIPAGTPDDTLRYDGSSALVSSTFFRNTGTEIGIGVASPTYELTLATIHRYSVKLPAPSGVGAADSAGGTLVTGTYFYRVFAVAGGLEGEVGVEVSDTVTNPPNGTITVSWNAVIGTVVYRVFKGVVSGVYTEFFDVPAGTLLYADDGTAGTGGSPTNNEDAHAIALLPEEGFLLPRLTTGQIAALTGEAEGQLLYDVTTNSIKFYNGTSFVSAVSQDLASVLAVANITGGTDIDVGTDSIISSTSVILEATSIAKATVKANGFEIERLAAGAVEIKMIDFTAVESVITTTASVNRTYTLPDIGGTFALGSGTVGKFTRWDSSNEITDTVLQEDGSGNVLLLTKNFLLGTSSVDGSANKVLTIGIGTEPGAAVTDAIQIFAKDSTDGSSNATLAMVLEQPVEVIGTFTASHKIQVWINGVEYHIQLDQV